MKITFLLLIIIFGFSWQSAAQKFDVPAFIVESGGKKDLSEIREFKVDNKSSWQTFHAKTFSMMHPSCLEIGSGCPDCDNPKTDNWIGIDRKKECKHDQVDSRNLQSVTINIRPIKSKESDEKILRSLITISDNPVLWQKFKINDRLFDVKVGVTSDSYMKGNEALKLNWDVSTLCKDESFSFIFFSQDLTKSEIAENIKSGKFEFPEEVKKMLASFKCKNERKF